MHIRVKIRKMAKLLERAYGRPVPRKTRPVDELIRTILSQNTTDKNSLEAFSVLKAAFGSWDELLESRIAGIRRLIRHAGLANIKSVRIKEALGEIKRREGRISLSCLGKMGTKDALRYLMSLKGVGPKTAACVLLFSFAKPIMPVDTHIFRVAKRLGLIGKSIDMEEAHRTLSRKTPKDLIYRLHLGIIEHGRKTCKAQNPRCGACVLYDLCSFPNKGSRKGVYR